YKNFLSVQMHTTQSEHLHKSRAILMAHYSKPILSLRFCFRHLFCPRQTRFLKAEMTYTSNFHKLLSCQRVAQICSNCFLSVVQIAVMIKILFLYVLLSYFMPAVLYYLHSTKLNKP